MRQEVAVVVVQAGQLRHLHQPESFQVNQEEKKKTKTKKTTKKKQQKKRNRGKNREEEGQKVRQGAGMTEGTVQAEQLGSMSCLVE